MRCNDQHPVLRRQPGNYASVRARMSRWTWCIWDPPFNSNATYNVLFKERTGEESPAQIKAFTDTWEWTRESERTFEQEIVGNPSASPKVKEMIGAFLNFIGRNAMMAYLVMMTPRLVELHRAAKADGSLYICTVTRRLGIT